MVANVVNDISVVCADWRGGDGVGEAVVAIVIGVNHDGSGAIGCTVIISVVVSVVKVAVDIEPGGTSVIGNVVVIIVFAVAGVLVIADVTIFFFFFSP